MTDTMRAYVIEEPGGPQQLELREVPRPSLRDGWVLIRIRFWLHSRTFFLCRHT